MVPNLIGVRSDSTFQLDFDDRPQAYFDYLTTRISGLKNGSQNNHVTVRHDQFVAACNRCTVDALKIDDQKRMAPRPKNTDNTIYRAYCRQWQDLAELTTASWIVRQAVAEWRKTTRNFNLLKITPKV